MPCAVFVLVNLQYVCIHLRKLALQDWSGPIGPEHGRKKSNCITRPRMQSGQSYQSLLLSAMLCMPKHEHALYETLTANSHGPFPGCSFDIANAKPNSHGWISTSVSTYIIRPCSWAGSGNSQVLDQFRCLKSSGWRVQKASGSSLGRSAKLV